MNLELHNPEGVHEPGPYTHVARMGDFVFVSGQVPVDPQGRLVGEGDAYAQGRQVFANLKACLAAEGLALDRVGKITMFVVGREGLEGVRKARAECFDGHAFPASTLVFVSGLVDPKWLVEVEAIAVVKPG